MINTASTVVQGKAKNPFPGDNGAYALYDPLIIAEYNNKRIKIRLDGRSPVEYRMIHSYAG